MPSALELEVEVKVRKPLSEDEIKDVENEQETNRILGKSLLDTININDESKYEYRRFTLKLDHVEGRGDFDGIHTMIYLPYGSFLIRMNYDTFNTVYEAMTGISIRKQSDFVITKKRRND